VALDTVAKRYSAIHLGSPWRGILPIPDGALGQADRQTLFFLCSTPLADVEVVVVPQPPHTVATLITNAEAYSTLLFPAAFGRRIDGTTTIDSGATIDAGHYANNLISSATNAATLFTTPPTLDVDVETDD
jgi:hypothetical protein